MTSPPPKNPHQTARFIATSAFLGSLILPLSIIFSILVDYSLKWEKFLNIIVFLGVGGFIYGVIGGIYAGIKLSGPGDPKPRSREPGCWFAAAAVIIPILSIALFFLLLAIDAPNWQ